MSFREIQTSQGEEDPTLKASPKATPWSQRKPTGALKPSPVNDFRGYMNQKISHLREAAKATSKELVSAIFSGPPQVCVWVTGATNPSNMELRILIRVRTECLFCLHPTSVFHHPSFRFWPTSSTQGGLPIPCAS